MRSLTTLLIATCLLSGATSATPTLGQQANDSGLWFGDGAGIEGQALTFVTRDDTAWLRATERKLGNSIPRRSVPASLASAVLTGCCNRRARRLGHCPTDHVCSGA